MAARYREKRTSITTVRDQYLSSATFPTPLIFHYPLPLKYKSASHFSIANYANNLDSCGEYSLRIWIKGFSFIPQFTNINEPI
jgi:hypothetical protein